MFRTRCWKSVFGIDIETCAARGRALWIIPSKTHLIMIKMILTQLDTKNVSTQNRPG